ncbi:MAG: permease-like cell division protein FtsX [Xanthomonadaceae bacterium]|nr:permease-like cell division protein FtsX [Xanthomonadaceae bacterium]
MAEPAAAKHATAKHAAAKPAAAAAPKRSRLGIWWEHHLQSLVSSLGRMLRRPWATLLTVGVMAVALALPLGLWLVLQNAARLSGTIERSREIGVFLKPEVAAPQAQALAERLRGRDDVATLELRTPEQGLETLRRSGAYAEAIAVVGENPLPSLLIVRPRGDETALAAALAALPETDQVRRDAVWRERLDRWLAFGERAVWVLGALLGLGALLVVGNTVRLDIQNRREEIAVLHLLGATDGFVRRPFLYLGVWYGLAAGALALAVLTAAEFALRQPLKALAESYGSAFSFAGMPPLQAFGALIAAAALGWIGAGVVTGHFLRQTRVA